MDSAKMPYIPEDAVRVQRVEIYFNDLKQRLKDLCIQHDEVIQNSVDIIKEINDVSSTILLQQNIGTQSCNLTSIKKLIQEFESTKNERKPIRSASVGIEGNVDIRKLLQNFEKLNDSHVLNDSLVLFRRAKESFEKIDTILSKLSKCEENRNSSSTSSGHSCNSSNGGAKGDLKTKIMIFNGCNNNNINNKDVSHAGPQSQYSSCCSSLMSLDNYHSIEEMDHQTKSCIGGGVSSTNSLENGYEGDNDDSEYDLLAIKRKKGKFLPPNI